MVRSGHIKILFLTLVGVFLLYPSDIISQISEGGAPPSFNYPQTRSVLVETNVPINFYVEDLREVDNWQAREGAPMPVAKIVSVDYTMNNSGRYTTLPGGENIWRLNLTAKDAVAIMLYYKDFYIPEGGKLFIYSADKSQLLGAYTHNTNPSGGLFATEFIGGDALVLEYVTSTVSDEKPRICIDEIGYGYNTAALRAFCGITTRASSGSCMVDINCEEGDAWQREKKGVCHTIQKVGRYSYICSASLMNNTAEDFKPLILTARHCAVGDNGAIASSQDMEQWLFYFHREREGCGSSFLPALSKTMTGCTLLANTDMEGGSDGMLLLLNSMIPESYDVFYNGWDRRDISAASGVSIHYPSGDYMKISTYSNFARTYTFLSSEFNGDRNAHWNVTFVKTTNGHGVTEGGSSGSPLYNENKLIVGTLTGGSSSCYDPRGLNIYGKLSYHWDRYKTDSSTRMDVWLDPLNLKVETFPGRFYKEYMPLPVDLRVVNMGNSVSLSWSAPDGDEAPVRYNVYRNNIKIGETTSLSFVDHELIEGTTIYFVSAVYASGEESSFATTSFSYVKYKAPSDLVAERIDADNVKLSWTPPLYEQTISWSSMDYSYNNRIGFKDNSKFYFGQKWSIEEISVLNENMVKAVQFVPVEKNMYEIYISQGDRVYKQAIESSILDYGEINTIALDAPFVIDGSKSLIVSIYISHVGNDYPASCDNGPVADEKGNIYSRDGKEWYKLYRESTPESFNYNFIVSAVISSERGSVAADAGEVVETKSSSGHNSVIISHKEDVSSRMTELRAETGTPSHSSIPAAFPEITQYIVYRSSSYYKVLQPSEVTFIDRVSTNSYYYEVVAVYGSVNSEKSNRTNISFVDVEDVDVSIGLFPTSFSGYVHLKGHEYISRVEVVSISGMTCLVVNNPGEMIDTSSLLSGMYFFRIYDNNNRQVVIKAIKTN